MASPPAGPTTIPREGQREEVRSRALDYGAVVKVIDGVKGAGARPVERIQALESLWARLQSIPPESWDSVAQS